MKELDKKFFIVIFHEVANHASWSRYTTRY